ncbi:MAG: GPH family glycoside/pentoside/hexuronide:cation symporter, partial [Candidatus Arcticimaribacter sp.]
MAVSKRNKLLYGLGFSSQGIKDGLFQLFLFFYFSQILGLEPIYAGFASVIALFFDAISDPLVGTLSDRWKGGKWGRRHPFMLLSALPLGIFIYILFTPPAGLDQQGLFAWLTFFSVMVRFSLTFFIVPGMSLGAELSSDYNERTTITSYRVMFSAFLSPFIILLGLIVFFTPTAENSNGLFNEAA